MQACDLLALHGQTKGNDHPAAVLQPKNKKQQDANAEKNKDRDGVSIQKFSRQKWGGHKKPQRNQANNDLLNGQVLHLGILLPFFSHPKSNLAGGA